MFTKDEKKKDIGGIFLGFAILMYGMEAMSGAVAPLADNEKFTGILTMFSNPILSRYDSYRSNSEFLCICRYFTGTLCDWSG